MGTRVNNTGLLGHPTDAVRGTRPPQSRSCEFEPHVVVEITYINKTLKIYCIVYLRVAKE